MKKALLLALLPTLLLCPASAVVSAAQEVVELRGTTTLVGSQAAVVRVRVPQAGALTIDRDTEIEGDGDFVGFALSPYPVPLDAGSPPSPEIGSVLVVGRVAGTVHYQSRSTPQVTAGEYLLYLLADGSPARVTFHLSGIDGALELTPAFPALFDARVLVPRVTVDANAVTYSAGDGGDVLRPGLGLVLIWLRSQALAGLYPGPSGAYGLCLYRGDPLDETVAYQPGCPLVQPIRPPTVFHVLAPGSPGVVFGGLYHLYAGRWGLGAWYESPTLVDASAAGVFWLTLAVPELPLPVQLVVSRKVHASAGTFDIDLPATGNPGIECRSGGANIDHQVVFTFTAPVTVDGSTTPPPSAASVSGTGSVSGITVNGAVVTVSLTSVTNAQTITITLNNVNDGTSTGNVSVPMGVLGGDTTPDRVVNSADITETRRQSGQLTAQSNFRTDVSTDGVVNSADITLVRRASGSALP